MQSQGRIGVHLNNKAQCHGISCMWVPQWTGPQQESTCLLSFSADLPGACWAAAAGAAPSSMPVVVSASMAMRVASAAASSCCPISCAPPAQLVTHPSCKPWTDVTGELHAAALRYFTRLSDAGKLLWMSHAGVQSSWTARVANPCSTVHKTLPTVGRAATIQQAVKMQAHSRGAPAQPGWRRPCRTGRRSWRARSPTASARSRG